MFLTISLMIMEMFTKSSAVTTFSILFVLLCDASLATNAKTTQNQKSSYIVHVAKSQMPESFNHPLAWFESTLKSVSDSAELIYTYDKAIHGFSTRLTPEEAHLLQSRNGILKVLPDKIYKLQTTRTPQFLGLDKIPASTFTQSNRGGSNVVIGVIDTGVWPESKSFNDTGYGPIPSTWKGKCEVGANFTTANCNKKLIGARSYKDGLEALVGPLDDSIVSHSPRDDVGHGTHTASTAAGSAVKNASLFNYASGTARGMAPHARVAVYKVCWTINCAASDILGAIDQAIADNVNVLSISLTGLVLDYDDDHISIGAFSAMEHGIVVSCAGGNYGPLPASLYNQAPWIITVGAGTIDRDFPAYVSLGNGQKYRGVSLYSGKKLPDKLVPFIYAGNASRGGVTPNQSEFSGFCVEGSLSPQNVKGKIVLCDSGNGRGEEKAEAVKSAGGLGMVLANRVIEGEDTTGRAYDFPANLVGAKAGEAIKRYLFSNPKPIATILFGGTKVAIEPSPVVAVFSSRGPNTISPDLLKPDLIAPGVNILATYTRNAGPTDLDSDKRRVDFNIISGTSMSCPHVSGIAALIKSVHPSWSPAAIRSAMMTTSYSTYKNGKLLLDGATGKPATPFDFGAGHVNPVPALNPGLIYDLTVDDYLNYLCSLNYTSKRIEVLAKRKFKCNGKKHYFNYPSFAVIFEARKDVVQVKQMRTLTNVGATGTYKVLVKIDILGVKVRVQPEVLSFGVNEKKSYAITFTALDVKPRKTHGFGRLEWSNGKNIVGSPIAFSWV
ncbi:subtilisin-like protease SBT1.7 [Lotus japonicus]|uniref:subtilisin-like protease SBT1.7 n=1 Tax=Lotus japonicus TaxID=34305 RepID=UPI002589500C|nr:subtilisin-like protease SBT1.7 [Lotus japonicus]